jgi:hypothetical protein
VSAFCGDSVCAARVQFFLADPEDTMVREPCPRCVDALADTLQVDAATEADFARTMRSVHDVIAGRL